MRSGDENEESREVQGYESEGYEDSREVQGYESEDSRYESGEHAARSLRRAVAARPEVRQPGDEKGRLMREPPRSSDEEDEEEEEDVGHRQLMCALPFLPITDDVRVHLNLVTSTQ